MGILVRLRWCGGAGVVDRQDGFAGKRGVLGFDFGLLRCRVVEQCFGGVGAAEGGCDPGQLCLPGPVLRVVGGLGEGGGDGGQLVVGGLVDVAGVDDDVGFAATSAGSAAARTGAVECARGVSQLARWLAAGP